MIDHRDMNVVRIPIDQITVMNPRERGKVKFKQIVTNISHIGLKKPITVVQRGSRDGKPLYELVCGQGRLEACRQLGDTTVPALVIEASREELLLMSLAENLARRRQTCVQMLRDFADRAGPDASPRFIVLAGAACRVPLARAVSSSARP